jgi:hypothetical protein
VRAQLETIGARRGNHVVRQPTRLSQFEHYRDLCTALGHVGAPGASVWILFSDDDDISHPLRARHALQGLEQLREMGEDGLACNVSALWFSSLSVAELAGTDADRPRTADDVDAWLAAGKCTLNRKLDISEAKGLSGEVLEYWLYMVQLPLLADFFADETARGLLRYPWCDLAFCKYVKSYRAPEGKTVAIPLATFSDGSPLCWYHYNYVPRRLRAGAQGDWPVAGRAVSAEDTAAAARLHLGGRAQPSADERTRLGLVVANVRTMLEMAIVTHAFAYATQSPRAWLEAVLRDGLGQSLRAQRAVSLPVFDNVALGCEDHFAGTLGRMNIPGIVVERSVMRKIWREFVTGFLAQPASSPSG